VTLFVPDFVGANGLFTSDINGDGGGNPPRGDVLPGTGIGAFGRSIGSIAELNKVITAFNNTYAGKLTPAGQRLVSAGLFTEAQMRALGAVIPTITLVPEGNPNPFENRFSADYRLTRPIKIWKENWILEPSLSVFNVFNNSPRATYGGLDETFGSLNVNYSTAADRAELDRVRGLIFARRQLQFGIRFSF
jgi:hypothetical protein